jgi:hypothetical protein
VTAGRGRSALERLVPDLTPPDDVSPTVSTFLRGLAIGALVGAAIAGSALLQRRRARDEAEAASASDGAPAPAAHGPDGPTA